MTRCLSLLAVLAAPLALAGEAPQQASPFEPEFALGDADLRAITLQVMEQHPILASSAGIKAAYGHRGAGTNQAAQIVFYPHAETAGVKEAIQVGCQRANPDDAWTCANVSLRRYVTLESQTFELRVRGDLDIESVRALVDATRPVAQANAPAGEAMPQAAIIAWQSNGGYAISWGSDEGYSSVLVMAQLKSGGNPAVADDWQAEVFVPEE